MATLHGPGGRRAAASALAAARLALTGCGPLTIRTWVTVVPEESEGEITIGWGAPVPMERVSGGFLAKVVVDTNQILTGSLQGTMELEDVRLSGFVPGGIGELCAWGDPAGASAGTVTLDLAGGGGSTADLVLDLKAHTRLSQSNGLAPTDLEEPVSFALGGGLTLEALVNALLSGSADGLFATDALFEGDSRLGIFPVKFVMDLALTNGARPPLFDADLLEFCGPHFAAQGPALYYGLNSQSSYLRAKPGDAPKAPLVIALAEVGAAAGDLLRISAAGTYSDQLLLKDGSDQRASAVFSSTPDVLGTNLTSRVPGAVDAGTNVTTPAWLQCEFLFCKYVTSNIGEDFRVDPSVDVVVPPGAEYLIVAPLSPTHWWSDDSGFGFGVEIEVNPAS